MWLGASSSEADDVQRNFDLLYFEPKGRLFFNENGVERGFGDGCLLCTMKNAGEITTDQIALV